MPILHRIILASVYHLSVKIEAYDGAREDFAKVLRDPIALRDMMSFSQLAAFKGRVRVPAPDQAGLRGLRLMCHIAPRLDTSPFAFHPLQPSISPLRLIWLLRLFKRKTEKIHWLGDLIQKHWGKQNCKITLVVSFDIEATSVDGMKVQRYRAVYSLILHSQDFEADLVDRPW
jgi:hypothetical protein